MTKFEDLNTCREKNYRSLYEQLSKPLHDFLYYKFGAKVEPLDKVQEAFIALWNNCKKIPLNKAKSYLFTVSNNLAINEMKHQKVVFQYSQLPAKSVSEEDPQYTLEEKEYLERYKTALSLLGEEQRTAFMMNKVEGYTHQQIADILGVTKKVVEYRIYSALKQLKESLDNFSV